MHISPYSYLPLITSTAALWFGIAIFFKNRKSVLNRAILCWCIALFMWLFSYSICYSIKNANVAIFLSRIAGTSVMFLAISIYHFSVNFLGYEREKKIVSLLVKINLILIPLFLSSDYFIAGVNRYFFGFYGRAGKLYIYFIIVFSIYICRALLLLFVAIKTRLLSGKKLIQAKYVFVGFLVATMAITDFFPKFGYEFYPPGAIFMLGWLFIICYGIFKHELMDITIVIKKGVIYSFLITSISIIYLILVLLFERLFKGLMGYQAEIGSVASAIIIAILFSPLRSKIQQFVDKYFFKGTQVQISEENERLRQEVARSERLKAVSMLASGMAHEVKNPLTAIKTFTEYLPEKKNDKEFLDKFSKIVGKEVDRVDNLVNQLLDFAKPSPLQLKETNIHQLLDNTLDFLNSNFIKHKIKVAKNYQADTLMQVSVDPNQFKQAILNIFLNAIDAMPGGGTLTITTERLENSVERLEKTKPKPYALNANRYIKITISDTGCGISKKDLANIFDPFYSKKDSGTGLGLSITHQIIREHKGSISVESKVEEGASFKISLYY